MKALVKDPSPWHRRFSGAGRRLLRKLSRSSRKGCSFEKRKNQGLESMLMMRLMLMLVVVKLLMDDADDDGEEDEEEEGDSDWDSDIISNNDYNNSESNNIRCDDDGDDDDGDDDDDDDEDDNDGCADSDNGEEDDAEAEGDEDADEDEDADDDDGDVDGDDVSNDDGVGDDDDEATKKKHRPITRRRIEIHSSKPNSALDLSLNTRPWARSHVFSKRLKETTLTVYGPRLLIHTDMVSDTPQPCLSTIGNYLRHRETVINKPPRRPHAPSGSSPPGQVSNLKSFCNEAA